MIEHFKNDNGVEFVFVTLCDKNFGYGDGYEIIGLINELTEEQCKSIVTYYPEQHVYKNYIGFLDDAWDCTTAKLSFGSLVMSLELNLWCEWVVLIKE